MPENEIVYRTTLDFEETIKRLRESRELKPRYDPESKPHGICHIRYKSVACNIGARGGIDIHWDSFEDLAEFYPLISSMVCYPVRASTEWVVTKKWFGRTYYMNRAAGLQYWIDYEDPWSPVAYLNRALMEEFRRLYTISLLPFQLSALNVAQGFCSLLPEHFSKLLSEALRKAQLSERSM